MPPPERLTTRILHPHDASPSTEDIFASALETLFTDDTQQSHGVPGRSIIYRSPRFGDVYLQIPSHPDEEGGRNLFAHYLWNAGVLAAEGIERGSCDDALRGEGGIEDGEVDGLVEWDRRFWDMRGMDVLELGAATALPSLISALSNARSVVSTDHPSSPAITMNAIESNFRINITDRKSNMTNPSVEDRNGEREFVDGKMPKLNHPPIQTNTKISVCGYSWGTETFYDPREYGKATRIQPEQRSFDRIIIADCLWMPAQHVNLVKTVITYLKENDSEQDVLSGKISVPCALVVAGFHTGRNVVKHFIEIATGDPMGINDTVVSDTQSSEDGDVNGSLRAVEIFEVDIDNKKRPWQPVRIDETKEQSKRWCVCAILVKR